MRSEENMADVFDEPGEDPVLEPETPEPEETEEPIAAEAPDETKGETKTEDAEDEPAVPQVPIHTLHEARQQNKELRGQLGEVRSQLESLQALKSELEEYRKSQQQATAQDDFNADPLGAIQREIQELKQQQLQAQTQSAEEAEREREAARIQSAVSQQVQSFSQEHEDYGDALDYVLQQRTQELQMMGIPAEQVQATVQGEYYQLAESALRNGENAAELVYNLARLRGFSAPAKQQSKTVESLAKGQKAAQSLAGTQGNADEVGLQDIAKMSDEEFDRLWANMEKDARGAI